MKYFTNSIRYGCNLITPRKFEEVQTLYSFEMGDVFSGGLVYEYSQESNNYGLVEIQQNGDVKVLPDFKALKSQFENLLSTNSKVFISSMNKKVRKSFEKEKSQHKSRKCTSNYENLSIGRRLPASMADQLIKNGVKTDRGKYVKLSDSDLKNPFKVTDENDKAYKIKGSIDKVVDHMSGTEIKKPSKTTPPKKKVSSSKYSQSNEISLGGSFFSFF